MPPEYYVPTYSPVTPIGHSVAVADRGMPCLPYPDSGPTVSPSSYIVEPAPPSLRKPLDHRHPVPDVNSSLLSTYDAG